MDPARVVFSFSFYSPCRAVRHGGAACSARGQQVRCRRLLLPRRRPLRSLASAHFRLAGWLLVPLRAEHERRWSAPRALQWQRRNRIDATGKSASVRFAGHRAQIGVGHGLLAAHLDLDGTAWLWSARPGQSRPGAVELLLSSVSCCRQMCCLIFSV